VQSNKSNKTSTNGKQEYIKAKQEEKKKQIFG
jgi:hypothetical protein